jgi:hypothetical protein
MAAEKLQAAGSRANSGPVPAAQRVAVATRPPLAPTQENPRSVVAHHFPASNRHGSLRDEWEPAPPKCGEDLNLTVVIMGASGDLAKKVCEIL